jgi:hypothetical protein
MNTCLGQHGSIFDPTVDAFASGGQNTVSGVSNQDNPFL